MSPVGQLFPYLGLDLAYASYKGTRKGVGFATDISLGGEMFLGQRVSFQFDFGPAFIYLSNSSDKVSASGLVFVVNFGLNYYFGSTMQQSSAPIKS